MTFWAAQSVQCRVSIQNVAVKVDRVRVDRPRRDEGTLRRKEDP